MRCGSKANTRSRRRAPCRAGPRSALTVSRYCSAAAEVKKSEPAKNTAASAPAPTSCTKPGNGPIAKQAEPIDEQHRDPPRGAPRRPPARAAGPREQRRALAVRARAPLRRAAVVAPVGHVDRERARPAAGGRRSSPAAPPDSSARGDCSRALARRGGASPRSDDDPGPRGPDHRAGQVESTTEEDARA